MSAPALCVFRQVPALDCVAVNEFICLRDPVKRYCSICDTFPIRECMCVSDCLKVAPTYIFNLLEEIFRICIR